VSSVDIALIDDSRIVWEEGFGDQDATAGIRATERTAYRVGSISKLITATAVLQLQEKKLLDIREPIERYAPEAVFRNPFNPRVPITLRHLLTHTAGILRESPVGSCFGTELVHPVGKRACYSNLGPTVAGYIVEKTAGVPFTEYARKNILATAFMVCLFRDREGECGRIPSKESLRRMFTVQFPVKTVAPEGYGLGYYVSRFEGRRIVSSSGNVYGYTSAFAALPKEKVGVVVLNNVDCANGFNDKIVQKALGLLLNARLAARIPPLPQPIDLKGRNLDEYAGKYSATKHDAWASIENGELNLWIIGEPHLLRPIGEDRFLSDGRMEYGAEFEFLRDSGGRVAALKTGSLEYKKVPDLRSSGDLPEDLRRYCGEYGWPHNILRVYGKDGKLTCLVEWFSEYPLERAGGSTFVFPDFGLYDGERIESIEDAGGRFRHRPLRPVVQLSTLHPIGSLRGGRHTTTPMPGAPDQSASPSARLPYSVLLQQTIGFAGAKEFTRTSYGIPLASLRAGCCQGR
jgi:serine beta-lactamase-like protein LACTB